MKNSTLLFRSIAVIILLAGSAHLVSYAAQGTSYEAESIKIKENVEVSSTSGLPVKVNEAQKELENYNEETDYIIGNWKVTCDSEDYKGVIVYTIKKEGKLFNGYTYQYEDKNGNSEKANLEKTLIIKSFDGYKGKGVYNIKYEGKTYDVPCDIDMVDENTFKLSYDYYGYGDIETWNRVK